MDNLTGARRELLNDKIDVWRRQSVEGSLDLRDYNRRSADALASALAEVDRCHDRLEIDHCYVMKGDERDLVREEIPYEQRTSWPDGIAARDATIKLIEEDRDNLAKQNACLIALLKRAVPTINAVERLSDIRSAGYPRKDEEDRLCEQIETFCGDVNAVLK